MLLSFLPSPVLMQGAKETHTYSILNSAIGMNEYMYKLVRAKLMVGAKDTDEDCEAFDSVPHQPLLTKLCQHGVNSHNYCQVDS